MGAARPPEEMVELVARFRSDAEYGVDSFDRFNEEEQHEEMKDARLALARFLAADPVRAEALAVAEGGNPDSLLLLEQDFRHWGDGRRADRVAALRRRLVRAVRGEEN